MKLFWISTILVASCFVDDVSPQCALSKDKSLCYTDRYDKVNVDAVLQSTRLLKRYVDCLMDRGFCTREGLFLKEVIPDVLQTECAKCNDYQKKQAGKILAHMLQFQRAWWNELLGKYDKEELFRKKYGLGENDEDYDENEEELNEEAKEKS